MSKNGTNTHRNLALGLGWFSVGLGLAQIFAPRGMAKLVGIEKGRGLMRVLGLRELINGCGILTQRKQSGWLWARVAGDVIDASLLSSSLGAANANRRRVAIATAAVAGVTAVDVICGKRLAASADAAAVHFTKAVTINRSPQELYEFWRGFDRLPQFMNHLKSVTVTGRGRSHWVAKGPAGTSVEWDAEVINERPNELIAWRSLPGSDVDHAGTVRFEPAGGKRGTVVKVELHYSPPAGAIGKTIAKLFGESPEKQIQVDLHRFKQLIETGEIATTKGQPAGRSRSTSRKYDDFVRS
jgi:uncharacterized membrane protein